MGGKDSLVGVTDISTWEEGHMITRRGTASTPSHHRAPQRLLLLHMLTQETHQLGVTQPCVSLMHRKAPDKHLLHVLIVSSKEYLS